jgi:hypothetical protein
MRTPALLLAAFLLLGALAQLPGAGAVGGVTIRVDRLVASYGSEEWKDEPATLGGFFKTSPFPTGTPLYTGTYENPYADPTRPHASPGGPGNYWGYNLTLEVTLASDGGAPIAAGDTGYLVSARIATPRGAIPAKLTKTNATSFRATFDLDGENGKDWPALDPGEASILVDAFFGGQDPTVAQQKVGSATVPFRFQEVYLDKIGFDVPERVLPSYSDVTRGNFTSFYGKLLAPGEPVRLAVNVGVPNAETRVVLVNDRRAVPLFEGRSDAQGRVGVQFEPGLALAGGLSGLLLLEAHLVGDDRAVGNAVVALPVSERQVPITAIQYEGRGLGGKEVPQLATVLVAAEDRSATPEAASRQGTLLLAKGNAVFDEVRFFPPSFAPGATRREARFPASAVPETFSSYNLLAIFLDNANRFYSFATASRGLGLALADAHATRFEQGALPVVVRSFNTNYDATDDPGLSATFMLGATGLPGAKVYETEVTLEEGVEKTLLVPVGTTDLGEFRITVNATLGDVSIARAAALAVEPPPGFIDNVLGKVAPGPGPALAALALAAAVALARRRRA